MQYKLNLYYMGMVYSIYIYMYLYEKRYEIIVKAHRVQNYPQFSRVNNIRADDFPPLIHCRRAAFGVGKHVLHLQTNPDDNRIYKTLDRFYYTQTETPSVNRIRPIYFHLFESHVYTINTYTDDIYTERYLYHRTVKIIYVSIIYLDTYRH